MKNYFLPQILKDSQKPKFNLFGEIIDYETDSKSGENNHDKIDRDNVDNNNNDNRAKNEQKLEKIEKADIIKDTNKLEYTPSPSIKLNIPMQKGSVINWRDVTAAYGVKVVMKEVVKDVEEEVEKEVERKVGVETEVVRLVEEVAVTVSEEETDPISASAPVSLPVPDLKSVSQLSQSISQSEIESRLESRSAPGSTLQSSQPSCSSSKKINEKTNTEEIKVRNNFITIRYTISISHIYNTNYFLDPSFIFFPTLFL